MSDERLRDLERRWKETGTSADEATYLLERVRAGYLAKEKLELAAYCGHPAAKLAISNDEVRDDPETWVAGLRKWGGEAVVRAARALARRRASAGTLDPLLKKSLSAVDGWIACPCESHAEAAATAAQALRPFVWSDRWDNLDARRMAAIVEAAALSAAKQGHTRRLFDAIKIVGVPEAFATISEDLIVWALASPDGES